MKSLFIFLFLLIGNLSFAADIVITDSVSELVRLRCDQNKFATMSLEPSNGDSSELVYKAHCLPLICIYQRTAPISSHWNILMTGKNTTSLPESSFLVSLGYVLRDENLTAAERDLKLKEYLQQGLCVEAKKIGSYPFL